MKAISKRRNARVPQRNKSPVAAKIGHNTLDVRERPDSKRFSMAVSVLSSRRFSAREPFGSPATLTQVFGDSSRLGERWHKPVEHVISLGRESKLYE